MSSIGQLGRFGNQLFQYAYLRMAMLKCLLIYFPQSQLKGLALRVYLGYQIQGITGAIKSFLGILGLRTW